MADFDGDWFDDGDNYDYVEETYDMAVSTIDPLRFTVYWHSYKDDLAAHAVPDPPEFDGDDFWDDHSRYDYWNDIEYDTDGYHDVETRRKPKTISKTAVDKISPLKPSRKRNAPSSKQKPAKKRKIIPQYQGLPPVLLVNKKDLDPKPVRVADLTRLKSLAIMPDWRDHYLVATDDSESPLQAQKLDEDEEDEMEEDETEEDGEQEEMPAVDKEALQKSLMAHLDKLGTSGPRDLLLTLAAKMLSGEEEDDESAGIIDQLVQKIHASGSEEEGDEEEEKAATAGFSKWVSGQLQPAGQDAVDPKLPVQPQDTPINDQDENNSPANPTHTHYSVEEPSPRGGKRKRGYSVTSSRKKNSRDHVSSKG